MRTQASKSQLSQYGEFSVAAELNRRGFSATVTYGNMKNTDVVAFSQHGHYAVVEVKTSSTSRFVTGITPEKARTTLANVFWVLISVQQDREEAKPRFFILSDTEIKKIQIDSDGIYLDQYSARHGKPFTGKGVPSFSLKKVERFEGRWEKIDAFLETTKG
jgi:Holliday junction resolvase